MWQRHVAGCSSLPGLKAHGTVALRLWLAVLVLVLSPWLTSLAEAIVDVNKSFAPVSRFPGQISLLTISLFNPNTSAEATGVALTDILPTNIVVADPPLVTNDCGGTVTADPGSGSVSLADGTIPPGNLSGGLRLSGGCSFTVAVTTRTDNIDQVGTYVNTIPAGAVASSLGTNPQQAAATLTVTPFNSVTGTKRFSPANVHGGGTMVLPSR